MNWTEWAANLIFLAVPPVTCAWGWWDWARRAPVTAIPRWRRTATVIGLVAVTLGIALGAFAFLYWRRFPGGGPEPPQPTRISTYVGFAIAVFGVPFAVLASSRTRVALVLCSIALLGFYFGMFLAP